VADAKLSLTAAELWPELVDVADLVCLTRTTDATIRARAHALLAQLGHPMPPARLIDARTAAALDDAELGVLVGESHVVGRATLEREAHKRGLVRGVHRD